jgi:3-hydroxyacyl-CoA dehydrogenase
VSPIRTEAVGTVLLITIDNPPVNATSHAVRAGLGAAIGELSSRPELAAAVVLGAGSTFIAGADIREFGQPAQDPSLPAVVEAIEACPKPVVAALHGSALGGGFELALACDARIALKGTALGLPEVTLGVVPGAGGTQRLPRRVGLVRGIELIGRGERISADEACSLHLLDAVVADDLQARAIELATRLDGRKRRIRDEAVASADAQVVELAAKSVAKAGKERPAVLAAIELVRGAGRLSFDEGLAKERARFLELRDSTEAAALRHQFFAEREATRLPRPPGAGLDAVPRSVKALCVIGAGTMGSGIAIAALDAGFTVMLLEQDETALQRGRERIAEHYRQRVAAGKLDAARASAREARLSASMDWACVATADLVIEAVFEDLAVKQEVFRRIDAHARRGAVLATNTSYLDVDAIAQATTRPQDVLGLHFFSPANVMKLLELVRGAQTAPDVLATGNALGKALRKIPVLCGNRFGFIGNRIYNAYRTQCEFMLEDGAWPEDVDRALEGFGFAMGPFAVADLSGLDIAWRMRRARAATRDPRERYVPILDRLCEQGRLGRKSGRGYYTYSHDQAGGRQVRTTDAEVRAVIEQASAERGITRRALEPDAIVRRALLAMVNEAALLLAEGVAQRAGDIDVVLVQGYGFPRWQGGPVFWARQWGRAALDAELQRLGESVGFGFASGELARLLEAPAPA